MSLILAEQPAPTEEEILASAHIVGQDPEWWFNHCARIKKKDGKLVDGPKPNILQVRVFEAYRKCMAAGLACLIMILKPRQKGASTVAEALIYQHMRRWPGLNGVIMGDVQATSDKVFEMFRLFADNDRYPWPDGKENLPKETNLGDKIVLGNGSAWSKETAGSKNAGRSGTVQVIHMDEVAFFTDETGKDPTTALLGSFFDEGAMSLGLATSTANGTSGWFYDTWNGDNNWIKIFAAWFEFDDSTRAFADAGEREDFINTMTEDEVTEQKLYPVTLEQLNWRRHIIKDRYKGDIDLFKQEMPSNDRDCFLLSSRPRFNVVSLKNMRVETERDNKDGVNGVLLMQGDQDNFHRESRVVFRPDSGAGSQGVRIWEEARLGCRYVMGVDTCRGKDQQMGHGTSAEPDFHSAQVWRTEYLDPATGVFWRDRLVAHHRSQVEADILAEIVLAMGKFYGGCLIVPELNDGAGFYLVKMLHKGGANLFRREPARNRIGGRVQTEREMLKPFGWNTDVATKRWMIEAIVPMVRDEMLLLSDRIVQDEFEYFIVNKHGQAQAMAGKHDDCVMSAALALYNKGAATEYRPVQLRSVDLMRLARDPKYLAPKGFRRG